ncbi:polysaccharide biosynthesis protein [Salibacterium aidingense]
MNPALFSAKLGEISLKNNVLWTKDITEAASEYSSSAFVMISTDKAIN